jgi:hypothetical protein
MLLSHEGLVSCRNIDHGMFFYFMLHLNILFHIIVFINVDSDNALSFKFLLFVYIYCFFVNKSILLDALAESYSFSKYVGFCCSQ